MCAKKKIWARQTPGNSIHLNSQLEIDIHPYSCLHYTPTVFNSSIQGLNYLENLFRIFSSLRIHHHVLSDQYIWMCLNLGIITLSTFLLLPDK